MKAVSWPMRKGHLDRCDHTGRQQVTPAVAVPGGPRTLRRSWARRWWHDVRCDPLFSRA